MISMLRLYVLPILTLLLGMVASWGLYVYENMQEKKQFQVEFDTHGMVRTTAVKESVMMFEQRVQTLKAVFAAELRHEPLDEKQAQQKALTLAVLSGMDEIRHVVWMPVSENATHIHPLYHADELPEMSSNNRPELQEWMARAYQSTHDQRLFQSMRDGKVWVIELFPMLKLKKMKGVLLVAWDLSSLIEQSMESSPDAGVEMDVSRMQGDAILQRIYHQVSGHGTYADLFVSQQRVTLLGEEWQLSYQSLTSPRAWMRSDDSAMVLVVGLLMSLLLTWLVFLIDQRTSTVRMLVKRRTQELELSRNRIALLMNSVAEGIYDMDLQGHCTFINQRALDMLGYDSAEQVVGKKAHVLMHHSDAKGHAILPENCKISAVLQTGVAVEVEDEVFWRADGTAVPVEYRATPVVNQDKVICGIVVTFLDRSEAMRAQAEREQMRLQVEHTQRLESLGVLAGGIAHDFNNLLTVILGNIEMARYQMDDVSPVQDALNRVEKAGQRAADLCQQMLAYAGEGRFVVKRLNLSSLVQDMRHLLDVSMSKQVRLHYHLPQVLPLIKGDESQMQQVVMNLLTNANEAMDEHADRRGNGSIDVTTGVMLVEDTSQWLSIVDRSDMAAGRYVYVEVRDSGCGMSQTTIQKMFDPFFTTKFTGRGLGMSAVLGIVRGHHGFLSVQSEMGQGSTIRALFPAVEATRESNGLQEAAVSHDPIAPATTAITLPTLRGKGLMLVVDDEADVREITGMMLRDLGYDVMLAEDGKQALHIYAAYAQKIDAVVLDLTMPVMGGEECLQQLKGVDPDVRVLMVSGYSEEALTGGELFLGKPFSCTALKESIARLLH